MAQLCFMDEPQSFWHSLSPLTKKLKLSEKWNLIAAQEKGVFGDNSKEPFQSYEIITSLRNELVHYKGTFLSKDETPTRKIKGLMDKFGVKSESTFVEDDCSSWVGDLLICRELGLRVAETTEKFFENISDLLHGRT